MGGGEALIRDNTRYSMNDDLLTLRLRLLLGLRLKLVRLIKSVFDCARGFFGPLKAFLTGVDFLRSTTTTPGDFGERFGQIWLGETTKE